MREILLPRSRAFVWRGAIAEVGENVRALAGGAGAFVLTDRNVRKISDTVRLSLQHAGFRTGRLELPPGELQKSLRGAAKVYSAMLRAQMDRFSVLVTVGGGVVGDLGGFVASTYMRGIPLFHVPTTLLAQVDAALGGKTAVNLPEGKNLVGTFYPACAVFVDPATLTSLPQREFVGGLAEIVKCGVIRDPELFAYVRDHAAEILKRDMAPLEEVIFRAGSVKAAVVTEDEHETGLRAVLNYGHTVGHALEAVGGFKKIHHGEAVAVGMEAEARIALGLGLLTKEAVEDQGRVLEAVGLPRRVKGFPRSRVRAAMAVDKKIREGKVRFALPESIGTSRWGVEAPDALVDEALGAVLS